MAGKKHNNVEYRTCEACGEDKPLNQFHKVKDGYYRKVCGSCRNADSRQNRWKNPEAYEKHLARNRRYRAERKLKEERGNYD